MNAPKQGDRVREIVSGYEGVVTGLVEYLWGCHQALVHYRDSEGKMQSDWYDLGRLEVMERDYVTPVAYSAYEGMEVVDGAARPIAYVGADREPPKP